MALNTRVDNIGYHSVLRLKNGSTIADSNNYTTLSDAVESILPLIAEHGRDNIMEYIIIGNSRHTVTIVEDSENGNSS